MKKLIVGILVLVVLAGLLAVRFVPEVRERYLEIKYDVLTQQATVESAAEIRAVLNAYPVLSYSALDEGYKSWSKSDVGKYRNTVKHSTYRVIRQEDFFKKLVGDFRIKDFVCRDSIFQSCLMDAGQEYYWLIDDKLPVAVLELQQSLAAKGYNAHGFSIRSGHRHPKKNEEIKGAGLSKHIQGQAIDMVIGDIDGDGTYTEADKALVLEIVEQEVIGNKGGIGRYPGTRTVHIDVRGNRARWDSY